MNTRNTRQKEIILECIKDGYCHPTITEIMDKVKDKDSSIGQATVYRNINKLLEEGTIGRVYSSMNSFHYDANTEEHDHFICTRCGRIIDLFDNSYAKNKKTIEDKYSFKVDKASTAYEGICSLCQND